jgi:hypothetical protein
MLQYFARMLQLLLWTLVRVPRHIVLTNPPSGLQNAKKKTVRPCNKDLSRYDSAVN